MKVPVRVKVYWHGARSKTLFPGTTYSTVARWPGSEMGKDAWSIVLEFDLAPAIQGNPSLGWARFLVDEAPHELLQEGFSFELLEGRHKSADVIVDTLNRAN